MRIFTPVVLAILLASAGCGSLTSIGGVKGSGTLRSEPRGVSGFKNIDAGGAVRLEVTVQKDFSVVVEADDNLLGNITTDVKGDTLVIGSRDRISPSRQIRIAVSMPELSRLDVSGASSAMVTGLGGGDLELTASGASRIKAQGDAAQLDANASGASNIDAEDLRAKNARVDASGASTITVNTAGKADLKASGASTVSYLGQPAELKRNSSGASTIKAK